MGKADPRWPGLEAKCFDAYCRIIDKVRTAAEQCGYAIAVHGSIARDIGLIAVPWTESALPAGELALCIQEASGGFIAPGWDEPTRKPHGRLAWCIHLGGGPYIDLSVMPREQDACATPRRNAQERAENSTCAGIDLSLIG